MILVLQWMLISKCFSLFFFFFCIFLFLWVDHFRYIAHLSTILNKNEFGNIVPLPWTEQKSEHITLVVCNLFHFYFLHAYQQYIGWLEKSRYSQ